MAGEKLGSDTIIGVTVATTFGTAVQAGANDKILVQSLQQSTNPEELTANPIGSGQDMTDDTQQGATSPTIAIEKIANYNDAGLDILANFMGHAGVSSMGSGAYAHSFMHNETWNSKFLTVAFQALSAATGAIEFPSCVTTKVEIKNENPPNYMMANYELLADQRLISGTTNTTTTLESVTVGGTQRIIFGPASYFLVNTQSGSALSNPTDRVSIKRAILTLDKPQEHVREAKGSAGNGQPLPSGDPPFTGTLEVELASLQNFTWFTAAGAGTEYKASLQNEGTLIGGSVYNLFQYNLPRLKLIADPEYNLSTSAINPTILRFTCMVAAANPSGMISRYPYFRVINDRSTAYNT